MWAEARHLYDAHRGALAAAGIALRAPLVAADGLMCRYERGVIHLALPDPAEPNGLIRASMIAMLLGLSTDEVAWMFRAQLSRLVAHEIGHALRDECGTMTDDLWREEQAAERFANVLCRPHISPATRGALRELLAGPVERLGGLAEAAACHRAGARALALPEVARLPPRPPPDPASYRDLLTFTRVAVAWGYLDLLLDEEDDLDACCNDLLLAA